MEDIVISEAKELDPDELQDLFLSVGWDSGNHPLKLARGMRGADLVLTAWAGDRLVGLISAISDRSMIAYIPYLLVRPKMQGRGIGRRLLTQAASHYKDLPKITLIAYEQKAGFYEKSGFCRGRGKTPMDLCSLRT